MSVLASISTLLHRADRVVEIEADNDPITINNPHKSLDVLAADIIRAKHDLWTAKHHVTEANEAAEKAASDYDKACNAMLKRFAELDLIEGMPAPKQEGHGDE